MSHIHILAMTLEFCLESSSFQFGHPVISDLCNPMNCSTPGLPVHHHLLEFTQTHVHWVGCHPTISSSVIPFSSCLQSFPASGSFQMSQLFTPGSQSIGVSASTSVLPMNTQDWSPLGWTSWIPRDFQESSPTPQFRSINSLALSFLHSWTVKSNSHIHTWLLEKP